MAAWPLLLGGAGLGMFAGVVALLIVGPQRGVGRAVIGGGRSRGGSASGSW